MLAGQPVPEVARGARLTKPSRTAATILSEPGLSPWMQMVSTLASITRGDRAHLALHGHADGLVGGPGWIGDQRVLPACGDELAVVGVDAVREALGGDADAPPYGPPRHTGHGHGHQDELGIQLGAARRWRPSGRFSRTWVLDAADVLNPGARGWAKVPGRRSGSGGVLQLGRRRPRRRPKPEVRSWCAPPRRRAGWPDPRSGASRAGRRRGSRRRCWRR